MKESCRQKKQFVISTGGRNLLFGNGGRFLVSLEMTIDGDVVSLRPLLCHFDPWEKSLVRQWGEISRFARKDNRWLCFVISTLGRNLLFDNGGRFLVSLEMTINGYVRLLLHFLSRSWGSAAPNAWARIKRLGNFKDSGLCRPARRRGGVGEKGCLAARSGCWGKEYFVGCQILVSVNRGAGPISLLV